MSFELKIDMKEVTAMMKKKNVQFFDETKRQFQLAGLDFVGYIQGAWYTGRKGNKGLRVIEGRLRDSWFPKTEGSIASGQIATIICTDTDYAKPHEFGNDEKNIPKRTFVIQDFKNPKIGLKMFTDAVNIAKKQF